MNTKQILNCRKKNYLIEIMKKDNTLWFACTSSTSRSSLIQGIHWEKACVSKRHSLVCCLIYRDVRVTPHVDSLWQHCILVYPYSSCMLMSSFRKTDKFNCFNVLGAKLNKFFSNVPFDNWGFWPILVLDITL